MGCRHPKYLDLTYDELLDWDAYFLFKSGEYTFEPEAAETVQKMRDLDALWSD